MKKSLASKGQLKKEDIRQAVVVDYKAIGCNRLPADAKPFIQYTLEWLLIERLEELFVCCLPDNAKELRLFVKHFLETQNVPASMSIQVLASENNKSTGDCLRNLDAKALIKSDFVIMDVGCCGNLPLGELLEAHKNLKKADKKLIMTSIVRNVFSKNPAEIGEFPVYVTEPESGQLLHYVAGRVTEKALGPADRDKAKDRDRDRDADRDRDRDRDNRSQYVDVPSSILLEHRSVRIHTNLCSTNLSVYSANVPALYAELFDSHSEADLIQAVFDNHDVLGNSIYVHIVDDLFSQRMADFGFAINQRCDQFDTNLIYKRSDRCQVLRKLVNDSLTDCTRLNPRHYLRNLDEEPESDLESSSGSEASSVDGAEAFLCEVLDSLVRGYEETIRNENLVLEVNSSKHAYNIGIDDVYATIARALLLLPEKLTDRPRSVAEYAKVVELSADRFGRFLLNYLKTAEARATFLASLAEVHLSGQVEQLTDTVLAKAIYKLYEIDALDEECILDWFESCDEADELGRELRKKPALCQLVKALEADSEEESD